MTARDAAEALQRPAAWVAALAIAAGPWAFGATDPSWASLLAAACLVPFAGACLVGAAAGARPPLGRRVASAAIAVVVVPALGLLPAPLWLRRLLVPGGTSLLVDADPASAEGWRSLSLAPSATLQALVTAAACVAAFLLLRAEARRPGGRAAVAAPLLVSAAGLAVFGVVQQAAQADNPHKTIYGTFEVYEAGTPFGPYVNRNHFAGAMTLLAFMAAGEAIAAWTERRRVLAVACASASAATAFALVSSMSRGAMGAAAVAAAVLVASAPRAGRMRALLAGGAALAAAGAVLWWTGILDALVARFTHFGARWTNRFGVQSDALSVALENPFAGTGAGSFARVYPAFQTVCDDRSFENAHSDWAQFLMETGLAGAAAAGLVARPVLDWWRRAREAPPAPRWRAAGCLAGAAAIAVHGLVEVNLHVPANALLTVSALSLACAAAAPQNADTA